MVSTLLTTATGGQRGPMEKGRRHKAGRPSFLDAGCTPPCPTPHSRRMRFGPSRRLLVVDGDVERAGIGTVSLVGIEAQRAADLE